MTENCTTADAIIHGCARLTDDDSFVFNCNRSVECFTCCCGDVAIVLTPYDALRLKKALGLDSSEFLEKHTVSPFTKEQKVPVVLLKMNPETRRCPFVTEQGCSVYADRPWACRMYPLGLAEPDKPTEKDRAFHFLIREDMCHGHDVGTSLRVRDWIESQGIEEYDMMGAPFKELMFHPFWDRAEALTPALIDMYYMACYDLDRFRRFVFETRFLQLFEVDDARVDAMRRDDLELLDFAMQWLKFSLFQERTMKLKPSESRARRQAATDVRRNIYYA